MNRLQILLIEDSALDAELIQATLREGGLECALRRVETRQDFLTALEEDCPDVILSDYSLPAFDGSEALEIARVRCPELPFLFVSGAIGEERAIETLKQGATDYVLKHHLERLAPSVSRAVREARERAERRRVEKALQESEERFRTMADTAPVMIWLSGPDGGCHWFNKPWLSFTGRAMERERGQGWAEGVHPEDHGRRAETSAEAFDRREPFEVEYRLRRADGEYRWVLDRGVPRLGPDGLFAGYVGSAIDITERKEAERAVRESEQRYRGIFNQVAVGVAEMDLTGRFVLLNDRFCDIVGHPREKLLKLRYQHITHPEDLPRNALHFEGLVRDGRDFTMEKRYLRPDGEPVWVRKSAAVVRDPDGRPAYAVVVVEDVSDQKRLEEELRRRVKELAEAGRRKDEFLAAISHELRNPLTPILNGLQVIRLSDPADPEYEEACAAVGRQVRHLTHLVDDLLEVSGLIHGKLSLHRQRLDLAALVRRATEDQYPAARAAGLTLTAELPNRPVWLAADPDRLSQVVGSMLNNAVKFTEAGGRVTVRVAADEAAGRVAVVVRDTGIGVSPDDLPHVTEAFTQSRPGYDRRRGGLGLGLAMVKGLVELHGGTLRVASPGVGKGTEVTVSLPLDHEGAHVGDGAGRAAAPGLRVLVIEDHHDAARTLQVLLRKFGHEVQVAYTGPAGVRSARSLRPDVVLCDLGLPEMDGFEVARALRRDPATASARLIAVSGFGQEEDKRRAREAGFDLHLTKPVDPDDLRDLLRERVRG